MLVPYVHLTSRRMLVSMHVRTHIGGLQGQREGGSGLTGREDDPSSCLHKETAEKDLLLL